MRTERPQVQGLIEAGVLVVGDGYRAKRAELADRGLPFARAANIDGGFHLEGAELLGPDGVIRAGHKVSRPGDVVFTSKGTVGRFALVQEDTPPFAYSPQLCFWRSLDRNALDPAYLFYWMQSNGFLHQVNAVKGQTDMADYVSLRDQRRMEIDVPPLTEQRRMAATLGALDDKIALNRRMNRTLEAAAQALFRHRFVDFDGRDDLVDSGTGPIPANWAMKPIGEVVELAYGKSLPAKTRQDGHVPVYGSGGLTGTHAEALVAGPGIIVGRKGTIGTVYWEDAGFFPIDTTFYVVPLVEGLTLRWIYCRLMEMDLAHLGADSAVPGLNRNAVYAQQWVVPPANEVESFERVVAPLMLKMSANTFQSRTLTTLRDALLPRLLSGELRVPGAEALVGA